MGKHTCLSHPLVLLSLLFLFTGCGGRSSYLATKPALAGPDAISKQPDPKLVRIVPIYTGRGEKAGWKDILAACDWADVIILGELHDDPIAHKIEFALLRDLLEQYPHDMVLSLEMLERDEQHLITDLSDNLIDEQQFAELSMSQNWAGENTWFDFYQPLINYAGQNKASTIAANVPKRYAELARAQGYNALRELPVNERAWFDIPKSQPTSKNYKRFIDHMRIHAGEHTDEPLDKEFFESMFRAQQLRDATMAQSILNALRDNEKALHVVGQFHSDFQGGLVQELKRRSSSTNVLTISLQPRAGIQFNPDDLNRADFVLYTGEQYSVAH